MSSDRKIGTVLGLAVGDALGTTYEFARLDQPPYPALARGPASDVVGGGPFSLAPGQVTDDTQMAVCLARSLAEHGRVDPDDLGRRYVAWSAHAFDIGNQTAAALRRIEAGTPARDAGLAVWRASGREAAGNGSLMRTAPIAIAYAGRSLGELVDAALADSLITHADPRCALACAMLDAAIACALTDAHGDLPRAAMSALVLAAQRLAAQLPAEQAAIDGAEAALAFDLELAQGSDPQLDRSGFVRTSLRVAFWHAAHTASWRDAIVDVASRGGDADTNAAITGALLGARDGASAIPAAWRERVLAATQPGPTEWADAHHPRHLLALQ